MEYLKTLLNRYWRTAVLMLVGIVFIIYVAFGFLYLQQNGLQEDTTMKIEQIKPVLSKPLPSREELQAEYDRVVETLAPITDDEAIMILVTIAACIFRAGGTISRS